jgi:hypothetical protein
MELMLHQENVLLEGMMQAIGITASEHDGREKIEDDRVIKREKKIEDGRKELN